MTVVAAKCGFEKINDRSDLEFVIMCTDSQQTISVLGSKRLKSGVQKIFPVGNTIVSGSGSSLIIDSAVAGACEFTREKPTFLLTELASYVLRYVKSRLTVDVLTRLEENDLGTEIIIAGPIDANVPWHLALTPLDWQSIRAGNFQFLVDVKDYTNGHGRISKERKASAPVLGETGGSNDHLLNSLLRVYLTAYKATSSLYVDMNFQLGVQIARYGVVDTHLLLPPNVGIKGNAGLDCRNQAERRVRLFAGHSQADELNGMTDFMEEARWLGEYHHIFNGLLQRAASRIIVSGNQKKASVTDKLRQEFVVATQNLEYSVTAFTSGSLGDVHTAVKAYHGSFT